MKTTSYEISKKLKEIGFEAETMSYWDIESRECQVWYKVPFEEEFIPAYDLETILDALPDYIDTLDIGMIKTKRSFLSIDKKRIYYGIVYHLECNRTESLADTAARLLIKLIEDKIITINK